MKRNSIQYLLLCSVIVLLIILFPPFIWDNGNESYDFIFNKKERVFKTDKTYTLTYNRLIKEPTKLALSDAKTKIDTVRNTIYKYFVTEEKNKNRLDIDSGLDELVNFLVFANKKIIDLRNSANDSIKNMLKSEAVIKYLRNNYPKRLLSFDHLNYGNYPKPLPGYHYKFHLIPDTIITSTFWTLTKPYYEKSNRKLDTTKYFIAIASVLILAFIGLLLIKLYNNR